MLGIFKVISVSSEIMVKARGEFNSEVQGQFYLPPLSRPSTSSIQAGSLFYGVLDERSGVGALLVGFDSADFKKSFGYDVSISGVLSASSDVKAGSISLKAHTHGYIDTVEGTPTTKETNPPSTL